MTSLPPLYNSRITRIYIEYLEQHYSGIDVGAILDEAGMTRLEVEDPAHWFNQEQVDRFNRSLMDRTGNPRISKDVGRHLAFAKSMGAIKRYALGFFDPASIYVLWSKLNGMMSRGTEIETRRVDVNRVEILVTPKPGVAEKPFQCENRFGSFESVGKLFQPQFSRVDHPECFHKGDRRCRYFVSWDKSPKLLWNKIRALSYALDLPVAAALFFLLPIPLWISAVLALLLKSVGITAYCQFLDNRELSRTVKNQGDAAQEHLNEINIRYNNTLLIQEIGKAISSLMQADQLLRSVVTAIRNRLDYDRGLILLADASKRYLVYRDGYGFGENGKIVKKMRFRLDNPNSKGIFVRSFCEQKPFIVDNINTLKAQFSERSRWLIDKIGAQALICVPIVFERETLGILAVDTVESGRKLTQSDLNLLIGIASQLAVSINNAVSYQKLKQSEDRYRDIFDNVSDFLYFHRLNGELIEANTAFKRTTGYSDADLAGLNIRNLVPEAHRDGFDDYLNAVHETGHAEGIFTLLKKDDTPLIVEYKNSIIYDGGRPLGVRGSARDITERWHSRKEKKRLEAMLERAKKMEAVGTLAGGVAHDLNNVLGGIVGYPELLLMDLPEDNPLRVPIAAIQESGQKASAIVQDLLTMARRGVPVTETVNLNGVIESYLASPEFEKLRRTHPGVLIESSLDNQTLYVKGSPVHLSKTIMNIVSNAAEAMPTGGILAISTMSLYVGTPVRGYDVVEKGEYAVLKVSDTGIGISKKDQKQIFEPFYTKKVMGRSGTGLGMSVVWATVKDHKGYIDIESELGTGTTFSLYFPLTDAVDGDADRNQQTADYKGNGERILVVDDVREQREIATAMLQKLGYRVDAVTSGEAAVEYLKKRHADLIVLDMIMDPGMDGLETYRQILELHPEQRAVIASGFSESERVKLALQIGAGSYVKKPYVLETIGMAVRRELDRRYPAAGVPQTSPSP